MPEFAGGEYFGVSGQLGHISELAAIQRALREVSEASLTPWFPWVANRFWSICSQVEGSSTFCRTTNAQREAASSSCNRSAGWDSSMEEAIELSFAGKVVPLASRCTVHCKSDITHKLNRHEASAAGHSAHAPRQHGQQSRRSSRKRTAHSAACAADRRSDAQRGTGRGVAREASRRQSSSCCQRARGLKRGAVHCSHATDRSTNLRRFRIQPELSSLPPLHRYADRVQVIAAPPPAGPTRRSAGPGRGCRLDDHQGGAARSDRRARLWPRITRAPTAIRWQRLESASAALHRQVGNRPVGSRRAQPVRPGNWSAPTWALSSLQRDLRPRRRRDALRRRTSTRSSRSAARTPSTSTCAMACRSTTR